MFSPTTQSVAIPPPLISQMAAVSPQMDIKALTPLFKKWYFDPVAFVREALHVKFIEVWQEAVLRDIAVHNRVAVRSGHGVGKSALQSWVVLWYLFTRGPVKVACTAPTSHQLYDVLWSEVSKWARQLHPFLLTMIKINTDRIELLDNPEECFAVARTARKEQPEAFQGFHCFSEDHEILTRRGWVGLDGVTLDDEVLAQAINTEDAVWVPVQAIHVYPFDGELNVYDGQSVSFAVTDEHRFPSKSEPQVKRWKMKRLSELAQTFMLKRTATWVGVAFEVPDIFLKRGFTAEGFAKFVGLWLSEGGVRQHSTASQPYEVLVYQTKPVGREYIGALLEPAGFKYYKDFYWVSDRELAAWLLENCGNTMVDKHIPAMLKDASLDILSALVEALWVGDGSYRPDGEYGQYYSTSHRLIDDVQEVLLKLGRLGSVGVNRGDGEVAASGANTNNTCFVTTAAKRTEDHKVFRKNIQRVPYKGRVWCVSTPTGTFFTRRNGRVVLSGNSENMMFLIDEASGVDDLIFEVGEGSLSTKGAKALMCGNPTRTSGYFYEAFHRMREVWKTHKVSCMESTRCSPDYMEAQALKYGVDSNVYRVRVLGEFPKQDDDTVISLAQVEDASTREIEPDGRIIWGLDVARFGNDRTALCRRQGNVVTHKVQTWRNKDTMQVAGIIARMFDDLETKDQPQTIVVDVIGIGSGVVDRMQELNLPVIGINVSESPAIGEKFSRLRDELWWKGREWFEEMNCRLPDDETLMGELATVRYAIKSDGKIKVESKDEMKKRGLPSPDVADSFILTFAEVGRGRQKVKRSRQSSWRVT